MSMERNHHRHGQPSGLPLLRVKLLDEMTGDPDTPTSARIVSYGPDGYFHHTLGLAAIDVYPGPAEVTMPEDSYCWVTFCQDSKRWEVVTGGGGGGMRVGKTNEDLDKGVVVTDGASLWEGDIGSETDSGEDVDVICLFDDIGHVGSGTWIALFKNPTGDGWYAFAKECGT